MGYGVVWEVGYWFAGGEVDVFEDGAAAAVGDDCVAVGVCEGYEAYFVCFVFECVVEGVEGVFDFWDVGFVEGACWSVVVHDDGVIVGELGAPPISRHTACSIAKLR